MATLDLTDIVMDPDFGDPFTIVRRAQTVADTGMATNTETEVPAAGSVQAASGKTLELFPELARTSGQIEIYTTASLRAASAGYAADDVLWANGRYTVMAVRDWRNWGQGWVLAVATQVGLLDDGAP